MKGDPTVITFLNTALKAELTAINQYFLHARMMENWGFTALGKKIYEESIDEMKHADQLTQRILMLDGLPNLQDLGRLRIGENPVECLRCDLELELEAHPMYREAIVQSEAVADHVSRELFVSIQESEEEHIDWLETQLDVVNRIGETAYLQEHL